MDTTSTSILDLPEELVLGLARYLDGVDVFRLSQCNRRLLQIFHSGHLWQQLLQRDGLDEQRCLRKFASAHQSTTASAEKLNYLLHHRLRRNWQRGSYTTAKSLPLHEHSKVGYDENHLVVLTQLSERPHKVWNVKAWDISCHGLRPVATLFNWQARLTAAEFELDLANVLVADSVCVCVFSGKGNDTPQEVIACDIRNDFSELWRDQIHDWGQFDLPRLFGHGLYRFNLLTNRIEVFHVRTFQRMHAIKLVEEMRYPRGDISGDGRHLAVPGKMSHNNSPAISVWTLQGNSSRQRFLLPDHAFCPYRWFEKTAVTAGLVYGLLNRRCLLIWDAETAECLKNIPLTDSSPGGDSGEALTFTFLTVGKSLAATINSMPSIVSLFDPRGQKVGVLQPRNGNATKLKVCDVLINDFCLMVRTVNFVNTSFEVTSYPLSGQATQSAAAAAASLMPAQEGASRIELSPVQDCVVHELGMTPTKLLNFGRNELVLLDFM